LEHIEKIHKSQLCLSLNTEKRNLLSFKSVCGEQLTSHVYNSADVYMYTTIEPSTRIQHLPLKLLA